MFNFEWLLFSIVVPNYKKLVLTKMCDVSSTQSWMFRAMTVPSTLSDKNYGLKSFTKLMKIFWFMAYFVCKYKKPRIGNKNKNGNIRKL